MWYPRNRDLGAVALTVFGALIAQSSGNAQNSGPNLRYGNWGLDLKAIDQSSRPGDDFFKFANGAWLERAVIPPDKSRVTLRALMTDKTEADLHALLEAEAQQGSHQPSSTNGKVGAFYKAFMDENVVESRGIEPIAATLAAIRLRITKDALGALMGQAQYDFAGSFFRAYVDPDAKNPNQYSVYLNQSGLGLPDRHYYLETDSKSQHVKAAYQSYVEKILSFVNWPEPTESAARIVAMETRIAEAHWTKAEARELETTYNPMTVEELEAFAPGFPWRAYLVKAKLPSTTRVIVAERSAFPKIVDVFTDTPVDTLQAWHAFNVVNQAAPYLSKPFVDANFEMYKKTLLNQEQQQARWKRAVFAVSGDLDGNEGPLGHMGWAVGQLYAERYFPPAMKNEVDKLVQNVLHVFRTRLASRDWMSPATRAEAIRKLDNYTILTGYPDRPQRNYTDLVVVDDDPVGNVRRAADLDWNFRVDRLRKPVDRNEWGFMPHVNNAANSFYLRNVVFPAALLQAPMFDPDADAAVNYGAFGAYAGHELTHAVDDQARKLDADGRLRDWWAADDAKIFEARAADLSKQYSAFEPLPDVHVNGDLTIGEDIADLGGLTLALDAYHASLEGKTASIIDGLTGDQRVFLSWAQAWRGKLTEGALRNQVITDPHAPRMYRVDGVVRNIDDWYAAFDVRFADKLYLVPEKRVRIW
jgi:putative endopeptidase